VARAGFDTVVFCAREYQPSPTHFPGVRVLHAPFDDENWLLKESLETAVRAASEIAVRFSEQEKILVTCQAGINRSGFVVALALHKIYGYSGNKCIELVRQGRQLDGDTALRNPAFVDALEKLAGRRADRTDRPTTDPDT
jgi:protein-tyrosine phosphatase